MAENRPLPRHTLAKNLRILLENTGFSAPEVARRAGVDRKTINNQLNGRYDPRPEQVRAVAKVFHLDEWDLINPNFNPNTPKNQMLKGIIDNYAKADEAGKESIARVAEMAAAYKTK